MMMMIMIMPRMILKGMLTSRRLATDNYLGYHGSRGCKLFGGLTLTRLCVGKYCTSNFVWTGGHFYDGFNYRSLIMSCMCLHSLTPIVVGVFFKLLKSCANSIFQMKARHPCTADDHITIQDHDICIR